MGRKGENIYKRKDGRWEGRYIKGYKPNGKTLYGSIYGEKYNDVKLKLISLKSAYGVKEHTNVKFTGNLQAWLSFWLDDLEKPNIKLSTYSSYRSKIENHILPILGNKMLNKLNSNDIQSWLDELIIKGLRPNSVRAIYRILNAALQKAVYKHCLFINSCANVMLPTIKSVQINALTISEQKRLEKEACRSKGGEAIILALYTGMRIGEISALKWDNIDFENNIIRVQETLQRITAYENDAIKTKIIIDVPKSNMSFRIIPFGCYLKKYLLKLKTRTNNDYVISYKGRYVEPRTISYRFRQMTKKADLVDITFHGLRHTYATRCMECGIDIVSLSQLLGHASTKMTLDTYADSTLTQRKAAMASLDMLLNSANGNESFSQDKQKFAAMITQLFNSNLDIVV